MDTLASDFVHAGSLAELKAKTPFHNGPNSLAVG